MGVLSRLLLCRLAGMLGALDTYSSQAVGARNYGALGSMFKQVRRGQRAGGGSSQCCV